jgi:hypothetical protein
LILNGPNMNLAMYSENVSSRIYQVKQQEVLEVV